MLAFFMHDFLGFDPGLGLRISDFPPMLAENRMNLELQSFLPSISRTLETLMGGTVLTVSISLGSGSLQAMEHFRMLFFGFFVFLDITNFTTLGSSDCTEFSSNSCNSIFSLEISSYLSSLESPSCSDSDCSYSIISSSPKLIWLLLLFPPLISLKDTLSIFLRFEKLSASSQSIYTSSSSPLSSFSSILNGSLWFYGFHVGPSFYLISMIKTPIRMDYGSISESLEISNAAFEYSFVQIHHPSTFRQSVALRNRVVESKGLYCRAEVKHFSAGQYSMRQKWLYPFRDVEMEFMRGYYWEIRQERSYSWSDSQYFLALRRVLAWVTPLVPCGGGSKSFDSNILQSHQQNLTWIYPSVISHSSSVVQYYIPLQVIQMQQSTTQLWKINDKKAQKNGSHGNIYWVRKQALNEDGSEKSSKWVGSNKYVGDWKNNKKEGFGIQYYENGNKYEGGWSENKRHNQGTLWVADGKNKLRREYTGDWEKDRKKGRGTMFFKNGDRYDGLWLEDKPHGEGRMIFANGDVYEGMWFMGKRSGYGVLTKRCGDHFEGHWVNDMREGQGSYFYSKKGQIFVGEWVEDSPKAGVFSEVEDPNSVKPEREKHFTDNYILPSLPPIGLKEPTMMLEQAMENIKKHRTAYRARYIPIDELYSQQQLLQLQKDFNSAVNQSQTISQNNLFALLLNNNIVVDQDQAKKHLKSIRENYKHDQIDFQLFVRLIAIIVEQNHLHQDEEAILEMMDENKKVDEEEEHKWYNLPRNEDEGGK